MCASSTPIRAQRVAYCTDVQGNLDYWERFIDLSEVLHRDKSTGEISMVEGAHFVYGGDSVDKGSGDLAFLKENTSYAHGVKLSSAAGPIGVWPSHRFRNTMVAK